MGDPDLMETEQLKLFTAITHSSSKMGQYTISNAQLRTMFNTGQLVDLDHAVRKFAFANGYEIQSEGSISGLLFKWRKANAL